jgi:hypothetical protein
LAEFLICSVEAAGKIHRAGPRPKAGVDADEFSGDLSADYNPWFYAICGTMLVGLTGIFPLLIIPVEAGHKLSEGGRFVLYILFIIIVGNLYYIAHYKGINLRCDIFSCELIFCQPNQIQNCLPQ